MAYKKIIKTASYERFCFESRRNYYFLWLIY